MAQLIKPSELALIKGVKPSSVTEAMKVRIAGAIVMVGKRRMLDKDLALELWDRNTIRNNNSRISAAGHARDRRPAVASSPSAPGATTSPSTSTAEAVAVEVMKLPDDAIPGLDISNERKEHYNAELAKVKALQARAEVGSIRDMEREAFALAKSVREGMLSIIPRVSSDLAALSDAFEIERLLETEMATALRMLADG